MRGGDALSGFAEQSVSCMETGPDHLWTGMLSHTLPIQIATNTATAWILRKMRITGVFSFLPRWATRGGSLLRIQIDTNTATAWILRKMITSPALFDSFALFSAVPVTCGSFSGLDHAGDGYQIHVTNRKLWRPAGLPDTCLLRLIGRPDRRRCPAPDVALFSTASSSCSPSLSRD